MTDIFLWEKHTGLRMKHACSDLRDWILKIRWCLMILRLFSLILIPTMKDLPISRTRYG